MTWCRPPPTRSLNSRKTVMVFEEQHWKQHCAGLAWSHSLFSFTPVPLVRALVHLSSWSPFWSHPFLVLLVVFLGCFLVVLGLFKILLINIFPWQNSENLTTTSLLPYYTKYYFLFLCVGRRMRKWKKTKFNRNEGQYEYGRRFIGTKRTQMYPYYTKSKPKKKKKKKNRKKRKKNINGRSYVTQNFQQFLDLFLSSKKFSEFLEDCNHCIIFATWA